MTHPFLAYLLATRLLQASAPYCEPGDPSEVCGLRRLPSDSCSQVIPMFCSDGSRTSKFVKPEQWFTMPGPDGAPMGRCQCPAYYDRTTLPGSPVGGWGGWGGGPREID